MKTAFNEALAWINGIYNGSTAAADEDKFLRATGNGDLNWSFAIKSDEAMFLDAGNGSAGQYLISDGDNTLSWTTVSTINAWTLKSTDFTTAANQRYIVDNGGITITLHDPAAGDTFEIKPEVGLDLVAGSNGLILNGTMQVAGAAANGYTLDENVVYRFIADMNGDNYDVTGTIIDRL